MPSAEVLD